MRRRLSLLLCAALAASVALLPTTAEAAVLNGGPLAAGVEATVDLAVGDQAEYELTVPEGARPVVTVKAWDHTFRALISVVAADGSADTRFFDGSEPSTFLEYPTVSGPGGARTLRIASFNDGFGSISLVVTYGSDIVRDVEPGAAVPLTFDGPGGRAVLSFDSDVSGEIYVATSDDTMTQPTTTEFLSPRVRMFLEPAHEEFQQFPGTFFPLLMPAPGRQTVVVDPVADLTGSVTVRLSPVPQLNGRVTYGGGTTDLGLVVPDAPGRLGFTAKGGARTIVQAVRPSLQRADGSPGSATLQLTLSGRPPVTLGTVGADTVSFTTAEPRVAGAEAWVTLVGDGDTTGSVALRVALDPGPVQLLEPGTATSLSVAPGTSTKVYGIDAAAGDTFELYLGTATYGDPGFSGFSEIRIESPIGGEAGQTAVSTFGPASTRFTADVAGRYLLTVTVDPAIGVDAALNLVRADTVVRTGALPFDDVLRFAAPGQRLALDVPGRAGRRLAFAVTDQSLVDLSDGFSAGAVTLLDPDGTEISSDFLVVGGTTYVDTPATIAADGVYRLLVDVEGLATGDVRVVAAEPADLTGPLATAGTPTPVSLTEPGSRAAYTFEAAPGDRVEVDVRDVALANDPFPFVRVALVRPDGSTFTESVLQSGQPALLESGEGLDAAGTWTVLVDPVRGATASLVLTRVPARVLTQNTTSGAVKSLAFSQPGDVHRLTFTGTAGRRPVVEILSRTVDTRMRLVGPDGLVLADYAAFDTSPLFELPALPTTGTWTLELDPLGAATGSVSLRMSLVADPVVTVEPGKRTTTTFTVGQNPTYRVQVKAGQRIAVEVPSATTSRGPDWELTAIFVRPDGSTAFGFPVTANSRWAEMDVPADVSGRWSVILNPVGLQTGRFTAVVWTAKDKSYSVRLGRPVTVDVSEPVQNAVLPVTVTDANVGKAIHWQVTGSTFAATRLTLVSPSGFSWTTDGPPPGDSSGTFFVPFFTTGTWQLVLDPVAGATGKARTTLSLVTVPPLEGG
ncbi:MAG: hypothetical protein HY830_21465 [Actinobacteria bacterium]|nr:hypothetical protein [Actinomycetota bacterium]